MWFALALTPAALYLALLFPDWRILPWFRHPSSDPKRAAERKRGVLLALGAGFLVAFSIELVVRGLASWLGVDPKSQVTGALSAMLGTVLLFAPIEEASTTGVLFALRKRFVRGPRDGFLFGSAIAMGFACVELALLLRGASL